MDNKGIKVKVFRVEGGHHILPDVSHYEIDEHNNLLVFRGVVLVSAYSQWVSVHTMTGDDHA